MRGWKAIMNKSSKQSQTSEQSAENGLDALVRSMNSDQNAAPVELWDPPYCGELDMVIRKDGRWDYNKTPIGRQKLVRLFATVLKREGDDYFLVTPVEKIGIKVEDVPFVATRMEQHGTGENQLLEFETNVGDVVIAGKEHQLRFPKQANHETLIPYLHIRRGLEARLSRPVYYELANLAAPRATDHPDELGVWSRGEFFPLE